MLHWGGFSTGFFYSERVSLQLIGGNFPSRMKSQIILHTHLEVSLFCSLTQVSQTNLSTLIHRTFAHLQTRAAQAAQGIKVLACQA